MAGVIRPRRLLVPEVVQTSAMDCGPAALKCLLEGFGIPVSYGRLREACQTDVDGTSIDTLEDIARQLRLDARARSTPRSTEDAGTRSEHPAHRNRPHSRALLVGTPRVASRW